jgi:hypothetical protein
MRNKSGLSKLVSFLTKLGGMIMNPAQNRDKLKILGYAIGTYDGMDEMDEDLCFIFYGFEPEESLFGKSKFPPGLKDITINFHTGEYWIDDDHVKPLEEGKICDLINMKESIETAEEIIHTFN